MKITDTLDQLLRSLLATGSQPADMASGDPYTRESTTVSPRPEPEMPDANEPQDDAPAAEPAGVVAEDAPATRGLEEGIGAPAAEVELSQPRPATRSEQDEQDRLVAAADAAESLGLGFHLGSAVERIAAASGRGTDGVPALREARWLIERYIEIVEQRPVGADIHVASERLARTGGAIAELRSIAARLEAAGTRQALEEPRAAERTPEPQAPVPPDEAEDEPVTSVGRELFMVLAKAGVFVGAVVVAVLILTLIGQIH